MHTFQRIFVIVAALGLLVSCAIRVGDEKRVERSGNGRWREEIGEGVFVGVSQHGRSQAGAIADATLNARMQIAESLGLRIEIESLQMARDTLRDGVMQTQFTEDARSSVYASALVEVQPDKVYWEKWMRLTAQGPVYTWKAWVRAPFSRQRHEETWLGFVRRAEHKYAAELEAFPTDNAWTPERIAAFFAIIDALLRSEEDFAGQLWLVNRPGYRRFLDLKQQYETRLRFLAAGVELRAFAPHDIFAGAFPLSVARNGQALPHVPLHISIPAYGESRTIFTDEFGEAKAPYRITSERSVDAHVQLGGERVARSFGDLLPAEEVRLLSPLDRASLGVSLWLFVDPENDWLRARLREGLQLMGYRVWEGAGEAAYRVEGKLTSVSTPPSPNLPDAHVASASLDLSVVRDRDRTVILTYTLPNERFYDTRGFGRNEDEALCNSLMLSNMGVREECVRTILRRIDSAIQSDAHARLLQRGIGE